MLDLTDYDYDALYVVVKEQMPRVSREIFPKILEQLADRGVIEITVADEEVSLRMPQAPELGVYRVERTRRLHLRRLSGALEIPSDRQEPATTGH